MIVSNILYHVDYIVPQSEYKVLKERLGDRNSSTYAYDFLVENIETIQRFFKRCFGKKRLAYYKSLREVELQRAR
jgi:hypothetical protein